MPPSTWKSPYLITLKFSLRRWLLFLQRRKDRIFIANTHRLLADELATYYFVRKCFYRLIRKLKARTVSSRGWNAATRRMKLRFKEKFSDIVALRKKQRLYFQYWYLSHKIDKCKRRFVMKTLITVLRLNRLTRSLHIRCMKTALCRWRRRSRWPLVEAKYRTYVYNKPIEKLRLGVLKGNAYVLNYEKAYSHHKSKALRKFVRRMCTLIHKSSVQRNGLHQLRRNLLFYATRRMYRNSQFFLFCSEHYRLADKHYQRRNESPVFTKLLEFVHKSRFISDLYCNSAYRFKKIKFICMLSRGQTMRKITENIEKAATFNVCKEASNAVIAWSKRSYLLKHFTESYEKADFQFRLFQLRRFRRYLRRSIKQVCSMKNSRSLKIQRSLSQCLRFWQFFTVHIKHFRLVRTMIQFHNSFRCLMVRTQQQNEQLVNRERAKFRFEYLAFRKTFRKFGQYSRRRKILRISYKTFRQIWDLSGIGKDQNAHPCSAMGQVFYTWQNVASKSLNAKKNAALIGHSIERKILLEKCMNHWEELHGSASCKYKILGRNFANWTYIHTLNTQVKLSNEIVNIGRRLLHSIKLKHCVLRWLNITRQHSQQKTADYIVRRDNFRLAAETAKKYIKNRVFRAKIIFVAWVNLNASRRYEMRGILLRRRLKLFYHLWIRSCYSHYIKYSLERELTSMSPTAPSPIHYKRLSSISGKFYKRFSLQPSSYFHACRHSNGDRSNSSLITHSPSIHDITINETNSVWSGADLGASSVSNVITGRSLDKTIANNPTVFANASISNKSPPRTYLASHLRKLKER